MKILHIANEAVSTGNGIINSAVDLACMQSQAGHDVSFVSSGGGHVDLLKKNGVKYYEVCQLIRSPLKFLRDLPLLKRVVTSVQPHVVHAHMMTGAVLMRLGRASAWLGDYGLVTTVHNEWRSTSNLMKLGDRVIVLSDHGRKSFRERGFPEHKLRVVRHGILKSPRRLDEIEHEEDIAKKDEFNQTIVTIAGLYRRKGIGELIQAFSQVSGEFPKASLHIIGWGPQYNYFKRLKNSVTGADRIHLRGFIEKPHLVLRQAAVFALASHTESFPLVVAEAREAGCAIVATTVGGIPELLEHGRAGILVPPHDPDTLAQVLRSLLGDPQELARWRLAAKTNLHWLSCERMTTETINVYSSLLQSRGIELCRDNSPIKCNDI